jgi:hypothetical protein
MYKINKFTVTSFHHFVNYNILFTMSKSSTTTTTTTTTTITKPSVKRKRANSNNQSLSKAPDKVKKPRKKKAKASEPKINLVTGQGKSAKIKGPVDSTLVDTSVIDNKGHIDYNQYMAKIRNPDNEENILPNIKTTMTLDPQIILPSHANQNMDILNITDKSGHYPRLDKLRKTSFFFEDEDDDSGMDVNNDVDFVPNQTIIVEDKESSFSSTLDYYSTTTTNLSQYHDKSAMQNEVRQFPIELLAEQGFTSKNAFDVANQVKILSMELGHTAEVTKKLREDDEDKTLQLLDQMDIKNGIIPQQDQEGVLINNGTTKQRRRRNSMTNASDTVKIAIPFTQQVIQTCSYHNTYKNELSNTILDFNSDRADRSERYFIKDPLDRSTSFQKSARMYPMFNDLINTFRPIYEKRIETMNDSIRNKPKFLDEEPLPKSYIDSYRRRPDVENGDQLCSNGASCCFNTIYLDENISYIGKVFYTKRERKILDRYAKKKKNESKKIKKTTTFTSLDDVREKILLKKNTYKEEDMEVIKGINNHRKLCIDCILMEFTIKVFNNISYGEHQEQQLNHFTVFCCEGEYSPSCLLPNTANRKPTGIVGCVPVYNEINRVSVVIQEKKIIGNKLEEKITNYIAETGQDF